MRASAQSQTDNSGLYHVPVGSPDFQQNHSTAAVTFDQHSLMLNGERVFLYSGEFHPWRQPTGPVLWRDVLEKMKAGGFSGVSIYLHWGATAFTSSEYDWNYWRSVTDFLDIAKSVGILVTVRPGPYINAETNAGGFPGWLTTLAGTARTNVSDYTAAWTPWISSVAKFVAPYQYPDGPVIAIQAENEFHMSTAQSAYMQQVEDVFRANGLTKIPIMHNDASPNGDFAFPGPGQVDMYGFDGYPQGFDCSNPTVWSEVDSGYDTDHQMYSPAEPLWLPEFQGGSFDWIGGAGYDKCYQLVNEQFANVYYKNNFAAGTTMMSLYMAYGGTNWGNLACPSVYSSYDYGAPIREDRTLTTKYNEIKLQSHFLASSPAFLTAVRIGNGTVGSGTAYSSSNQIYTTNLRDPSTNTNFYIVRQTTNSNTSPVQFSLQANVSQGVITIPQYNGTITLAGRESKIIVTNYGFGSSTLVYSTAEVFTWTTIDQVDHIILYTIRGQSIEAVVSAPGAKSLNVTGSTTIAASIVNGTAVITGTASGMTVVNLSTVKIIVVDKDTAYTFSQPRLANSGYFNIGPATSSVLVSGPYLVRNATITGNNTLNLVGDINSTTTVNVFATKSIASVTWNGARLHTKRSGLGTITATIPFKYGSQLQLPSLSSAEWLCHDTFPERAADYDDSLWTVANKTTTVNPTKPVAGKYVLNANEYGYYQGNLIFRGHFSGNNATSLSLSFSGGYYFAWSLYVNGNFIQSAQDDGSGGTWTLTPSQLNVGDNVVAVIMDSTGLDEENVADDSYKHPRGIAGYSLTGADFTAWKVAGNYLGANFPDKVRGPLNEGGLWAERVGAAHLPGYPAANWTSSAQNTTCSPFAGIGSAGATAYRTSFSLDLPTDADTPIALKITPTTNSAESVTSNYRALIYINGWQFGRYYDNAGPQTLFPLPEGILNHRGSNDLLITIWSLDSQGAKISALELVSTAIVQSSKGFIPTTVVSPTYQELR
ncbi:glycoside hydrolase family 35 protein [Clavulina sp. PMI_390]|nr:glycoside hydrolase family 35 protein [Clavulina sp. PMI_390]